MSSALDLITDALVTLGECGVGEPISAEDGAYGLLRLNSLLESWSIRRLFIFNVGIASYPLIASNPNYQIGPGGVFVAPRPLRIDAARILLNVNNNYVGVKDLKILTLQQFVELSDKLATAAIPEKLYNDGAYPNSTLSLYPAPTCVIPSKLELSTWSPLPQFADLLTSYSFPPGYYDALVWSMVVELGPGYNKPPSEAQAAKALEYMKAIQDINRENGLADMMPAMADLVPATPAAA
jgi:hypothetical protein